MPIHHGVPLRLDTDLDVIQVHLFQASVVASDFRQGFFGVGGIGGLIRDRLVFVRLDDTCAEEEWRWGGERGLGNLTS